MRDKKCVDVVIPVFNGRDTIRAALISVLAQHGDLVHRIIVVDDGSNDDTAQVVQDFSSPLIELLRTPNQGVAMARNQGIEKSTVDWIAFLDADDVWMPCKLQAQLIAAHEYGAGFVCGSLVTVSTMPSGPISLKLLARGNFVATSSVIVKRSVLQQVPSVFTPNMSFAEDYLAWLKCNTLTSGYYISTKLVDYILSEKPRYQWRQIFNNIVKMNLEYARFLREIDMVSNQRIALNFLVFMGSVRSLLSICKRFFRSYCQGILKK